MLDKERVDERDMDEMLRRLVPPMERSPSWKQSQRDRLMGFIESGGRNPASTIGVAEHRDEANRPQTRHRMVLGVAAAATVAAVVIGLVVIRQSQQSVGDASPAVSTSVAELTVPEPSDVEPTPGPALRPGSFPVWPADGLQDDDIRYGYSGVRPDEPPITAALVENIGGGFRADPVVVAVSAVPLPELVTRFGLEAVGSHVLPDGTSAQLFVLESGDRALTYEDQLGLTTIVVGNDPVGFIATVGRSPIEGVVVKAAGNGAEFIDFDIRGLPDGYELAVRPTPLVPGSVFGSISIDTAASGFADENGFVHVRVSTFPGILNVFYFGALDPVDLADGVRGWWSSPPSGDVTLTHLVWKLDDGTWVLVAARDRDQAVAVAATLQFVDEETWREQHDPVDAAEFGLTDAASTPDTSVETTAVPVVEGSPPVSDVLIDLGLVDADGPRVVSGQDAVDVLARVEAYRNEVFRSWSGFAATSATWSTWVLADGTKPRPDDPPRVFDVTVLGTGELWAEFSNGDWYGFDPSTGVGRGLFENPVAGVKALELVSSPWENNYYRLLAPDPRTPIDSHLYSPDWMEVDVSMTSSEGGPAIQVLFDAPGDANHTRYVIDLASGLIVEVESIQTDENGTAKSLTVLTNLKEVGSLPLDTPPPLPEGVSWERVEDQQLPSVVSIEQAAQAFGPGLIVPAEAIENGNVLLEQSAVTSHGVVVDMDSPNGDVRSVRVTWVSFEGLTRTVSIAAVERPGASGTIPPEYTQIGDQLCYKPCLEQNTRSDPSAFTPLSGALAGTPFFGDTTSFAVWRDGIWNAIEAPSLDQALNVANTLVAVTD